MLLCLLDLCKPLHPSQDILALLEFKKGIKHDPTSFILSSWNEESIDFNGCPSSWNGIICDAEGNVAAVVLYGLSISVDAELTLTAFSNLTHLVKLSVSKNLITGNIPNHIIPRFKNLQYLDLSDNLFTGNLPIDIAHFPTLKNLSLAGNNFSGSIPDSISRLSSSLQTLDLSRNAFSGALPTALLHMDNLVSLNLSCNAFSGRIPPGFEQITSLEVLDLHQNELDGHLDFEFLLSSSVVHVDFSGNFLSTYPSQNQQQKFLPRISETIKYLNLSKNRFTGTLVNGGELPMFESLKVLDLSYNQLSGELPEFNFVYELETLRLGNNLFSGLVPNGLLKGDSLVLKELDLSSNNLTGTVSMISSTSLRVLNLSSNGVSGELPLLVVDCVVLDLSRNQFTGNLSRLVKWGDSIEFLDLSQNQLVGSIPESSSQFLRLSYLNLSHNSLSNTLPTVLTQYPKLKSLDISFNQLSGPLLTDLLTLPTLQELHLENNILTGAIKFSPPSPNVPNLMILDLAHNRFSGYFPAEFGSLTGLNVLDLAGNNLSGSLPSSIGGMSSLTSLDISQNHFTGSLLENMPTNLQSFNASYNDLSGPVPVNLQKFPDSSFHPGNPGLQLPSAPTGGDSSPTGYSARKPIKTVVKVVVIVTCVFAVIILILLAVFIHYIRISRRSHRENITSKDVHRLASSNPGAFTGREIGGPVVVSAEDLVAARKGSSSEIISPDEKAAIVSGFSPSKTSHISSSPDSGDSFNPGNLARLDVRSPDRLAGELHFLDDSIMLTPEELSRAPAEVLGRSSHGTSYRATLDNGVLLTVKWLREGVAKQKKEFSKEAKKFANIRHPNVVGLRGYYWGPTQHEKLILSDYISPGSLASFLYDRPRRKGPPLSWTQRLKIAVDVARGLNYLHFDREVPHGNLKSTNILLDGPELNARVADYCLHRLMTQTGTVEQILDAGVLGYRAPELAAAKKPSPSFKSDVFAFGVILLELLTGKCAGNVVSGEAGEVDLIDWVRLKVAEGNGTDCFDAALLSEMETPAADKGIKVVLGIALRCIRPLSERPGIKSVYEDLSSV
ncbi:Leucine-rich receptor-like protein kinase family protein [Thalictrum thalictroides]|uniref:Leucine-rich receptor-like protein kinase family protein n=1 Tax=Thalictrum thalictroides TaxID=46969 RepID=A0A7J6VVR4_THATH|nr:Leucine-rich receptor-like protein kinase family protein [Thalictrum thalictroides]